MMFPLNIQFISPLSLSPSLPPSPSPPLSFLRSSIVHHYALISVNYIHWPVIIAILPIIAMCTIDLNSSQRYEPMFTCSCGILWIQVAFENSTVVAQRFCLDPSLLRKRDNLENPLRLYPWLRAIQIKLNWIEFKNNWIPYFYLYIIIQGNKQPQKHKSPKHGRIKEVIHVFLQSANCHSLHYFSPGFQSENLS